MKAFIEMLKEKDVINRIQNKFFIRIGLFMSSDIYEDINARKIDSNYIKKQIDITDELLLKAYATKNRGKSHYQKNILPRLRQENRFKGFAVIDAINNEIAYLSWIDFKNITIPEIHYYKNLAADEAYFLDDHCVKNHQRKGLHKAVFNERLSYCEKIGVKKIFITIYLNNNRALQNLKKYTFNKVRTFVFYPWISSSFRKNIN